MNWKLSVRSASRNPLPEALSQAVGASRMAPLGVRSECLPLERQLPHERMVGDAVMGGGEGAPGERLEGIWREASRARGWWGGKARGRESFARWRLDAREARGRKSSARESIWRESRGWSEHCEKYSDGSREIHVPQGSFREPCVRVPRISREVRLGRSDGSRPIGSELAALGKGRPGRF